jgi:hypothetical protein
LDGDIDVGDILSNPHALGMPTFQEFARNPEYYRRKWRKPEDELLRAADEGRCELTNLRSQKHRIKTRSGQIYDCASIEKVESIAKAEGMRIKDLAMIPELREDVSGKIAVDILWVDKTIEP